MSFAMSSLSDRFAFEALTYDDVLILPGYSEVLPKDTDTRTQLTKSIHLNIPLVSAAMDTVTEYELAIAIAQEGGMGFIHKNMTIDQQAEQVRKVKRSESGMIIDPVTVSENAVLADVNRIMSEQLIGGIPVVNDEGVLKGIITNRDMRFEKDFSKPVTATMTRENLITAKEGISMDDAENMLKEFKIEKLPILDDAGRLVGLITFKDIIKRKFRPNACKDVLGRLRVGAAVGATADLLDRVAALHKAGADVIGLDTAHGHSAGVIDAVRKIKAQWPDIQVVAGNIATREAAEALAKAGADGIKVGVGPGSICTTRIIAGIGVPQLSAILEAAAGAAPYGVPIIADGGIRFSGDITKALAAGASCVMIGSMFAGTEEAPGEMVMAEGRKFKTYRGMGSLEAMETGSKDRYFQAGEADSKKLVPEGIVGRVPFKGKVSEVIFQLVGGLRAGMGYCGTPRIQDLHQTKFIRITSAGVRESHPHDVVIMRESSNYSLNR
jgi:IMP dehydrogenase